jgi:GST-like protein
MADYKLWGRAGWGSTIVEAQLVWYGLPYTFEAVDDLFRTPDADAKLKKVNPLAQVPTLEMPDGSVMSESAAITLLLADITAKDSLVPPANAKERGKFLRWLVFIVANIYPTFTYADDPSRFVSVSAARDPFRAATDAYAQRLWRQIEREAGRALLRPRHLHRHHDALAAQARLVRERDAAPLRHCPACRPGA